LAVPLPWAVLPIVPVAALLLTDQNHHIAQQPDPAIVPARLEPKSEKKTNTKNA
jgi:hypothetical protein